MPRELSIQNQALPWMDEHASHASDWLIAHASLFDRGTGIATQTTASDRRSSWLMRPPQLVPRYLGNGAYAAMAHRGPTELVATRARR